MKPEHQDAETPKHRNAEIGPTPEPRYFQNRPSAIGQRPLALTWLAAGFLWWLCFGCQLHASNMQHSLKGGHFIQVEWYNYTLDPARAAGVVDLRFHEPARQAFAAWADTVLATAAIPGSEAFRPGGRLVFLDFDGNITTVEVPNDSINKLCRLHGEYFTQNQKLLERAMVYLTVPTTQKTSAGSQP